MPQGEMRAELTGETVHNPNPPQYPTRCCREGALEAASCCLTNFVGYFLLVLSFLFSLLLLSALNDLTGPSAGPLTLTVYS